MGSVANRITGFSGCRFGNCQHGTARYCWLAVDTLIIRWRVDRTPLGGQCCLDKKVREPAKDSIAGTTHLQPAAQLYNISRARNKTVVKQSSLPQNATFAILQGSLNRVRGTS